MGWYDKFQEEQLLTQQEDGHNKFWSAQMHKQSFMVTIRWGRLGTKGQSQQKSFSSESSAARFISSKMTEKTNKGYRPITRKKFDELSIQAAIVGASNKCSKFQWIEITDEKELTFQVIDDLRLGAPDCNPGIAIDLETKKSYDGRTKFSFLFTFSQVFLIKNGPPVLVTKSHPVYELTQKVEEALGRSLS